MWCKKYGRWLTLLGVVVGCNAKLSVDPGAGAAGGTAAGASGKTEGDSDAGTGDTPVVPAGASGVAEQAGGGAVGSRGGASGVGGGAAGRDAPGGSTDQSGSENGGSAGAPPVPGQYGQPCIPAETIATGSSVAAAQTATLDRCFAGLSCNNSGKCVAIPDCPKTTGKCVEYDSRTGGNGGAGGALEVPAIAGANAAGSGNPDFSGPIPTPEESGVTALAIDDTHLYWLEYGTRDSLGNYQNDGALVAMSLEDGTKKKLATAIAGPNALSVAGDQAYVITDGAALIGTPAHLQLVRFPLAGGNGQLIQDGSPPLLSTRATTFASVGSTVYWTGPNLLYSVTNDGTMPTTVGSSYVGRLRTDGTYLYFDDGTAHISRSAVTNVGAVESLMLDLRPFDLNGGSIYGLENTSNGSILTKSAKSNPSWLRVRALGEQVATRLVFASDRLFFEWAGTDGLPGLTTTTLSSTTPTVRLLDPAEGFVKSWVANTSKVYWTDGRRVYSRAIPTP